MISSSHPDRLVVAGYLRDFPGIERWVNDGRTNIKVEKVDFKILNAEPGTNWSNLMTETLTWDYYLMSKDRQTILATALHKRHEPHEAGFRLFHPSTWGRDLPAEKVAEAMVRLSHDDWPRLGYVVMVDNYSIVIYKIPKQADCVSVNKFVDMKRQETNYGLPLE